jgi:hypothetical protein
MLSRITLFALDRPKTVIGLVLVATVLFAAQFPRVKIDTDPGEHTGSGPVRPRLL